MKKTHLIVFLIPLVFSCAERVPERPNILFIMTDDHAYQALSAYDNRLIETPNIDRLATEGMLFKKAFVSNSICSPSRAVALTGKFSHLNSVRDNLDVFDSTQITFPRLLQQNGYQTAVYGKWHLKSSPQGFDDWAVLPGQGHYYDPEFRTKEGIIKEDGYVTELVTDNVIDFLENKRDKDKPFMVMYNHKAPHRQWWPTMEDLDAINGDSLPLPYNLFDDYQSRGTAAQTAEMRISDHMGLSSDNKIRPELVDKLGFEEFLGWYKSSFTNRYNRLSDEQKQAWDSKFGPINEDFEKNTPQGKALTIWKYRRYMEDYLGTIVSVDREVGRVLDYLDANGLADNTIVVYTSDQGFYLGEHGWFDKRFMYEESFRTPLLMRYPKMITPGTISTKLVQNIDFAPTFLALAQINIPAEIQGQSIVPLLNQSTEEWRDALYYHYYEYPGIHQVKRHYGIRTDRFKLIRFYYDVEEWELYDLEADPNEMYNLYGDPDYENIRNELTQRLEELRTQYGDSDELNQQFIESDIARLKERGWL